MPAHLPDETALIERCQDGDPTAFETIVHRYTNLVASVAVRVLGDRELARDVVQEVFLKVHRTLCSLRERERFRSWLVSIARRTAIDHVRRLHKAVSLECLLESTGESATESLQTPPARAHALSELCRTILEWFDDLPKAYQEVLYLKHVMGWSYREIQTTLVLTRPAIEARLYRARRILRSRLRFHERTGDAVAVS